MKKLTVYKIIISILFLLQLSNLKAIESGLDVYINNKDIVLKQKITSTGDYYFSTSRNDISNIDIEAVKFARQNSEANSLNNFYELIGSKISWPENIDSNLKKYLIAEYEKFAEKSINNEISTVAQDKENKTFYTVKAVKKDTLNNYRISYDKICTTLKKAFADKTGTLNSVIYLEVCPESEIPEVLNCIASNPNYKSNAKAVFLNKKAPVFPNYTKINNLNNEYLNSLNTVEMIQLMEDAPYYPLLCWKIGNRLKKYGLVRNSQIFYCAGTKWPLSRKYNLLCRENIFDSYFIERISYHPDYIYSLKERIKLELIGKDIKFTPNCNIIIDSLGSVPVSNGIVSDECQTGRKCYTSKQPNLELALKYYFLSIQKGVNSENCNMIGNCLYYSGYKELSLPFFLQAVEINPKYKDALINSAMVFDLLGKKEPAVEYANKAKNIGNLTAWEKKEITKILNS